MRHPSEITRQLKESVGCMGAPVAVFMLYSRTKYWRKPCSLESYTPAQRITNRMPLALEHPIPKQTYPSYLADVGWLMRCWSFCLSVMVCSDTSAAGKRIQHYLFDAVLLRSAEFLVNSSGEALKRELRHGYKITIKELRYYSNLRWHWGWCYLYHRVTWPIPPLRSGPVRL